MASAPDSGAWTLRRLLLGDWGRLVRDPLDLWRAALVLAAVVLLVRRGVDGGTVTFVVVAVVAVAVRPLLLPRLTTCCSSWRSAQA